MPDFFCLTFYPPFPAIHQNIIYFDENGRNFYLLKSQYMKKVLVALVLMAGLTAVAFASFNNKKKGVNTEQKVEKKECKHKCMFS
jgi:hypothetical protein